MLPADIVGSSVYNQRTGEFRFAPGAIFANIVIGDEINRASPKTQSALLEAMQEGAATVDGKRYKLPRPFMVVATQNPVEMEGTYRLPEAQLDRFMLSTSVGYPSLAEEVAVLDDHEISDPIKSLHPVADIDQVLNEIGSIRALYVAPVLKQYIVRLADATRSNPELSLGVSPRASIQLLRAAKAMAALSGRAFVLPDDIQQMLIPVWSHRVLLSSGARAQARTAKDVLSTLREQTPVE
jgi:MoxR-like ATPase